MKSRTLFLLVAVLVTFGPQAAALGGAAQPSPANLTLDRAVQIAISNSPEMHAAQERVNEARMYAQVQKFGYYPYLSFNGIGKLGLSGATNGLGLLGLPASPFFRNLADAFNVNQNIFDFGRTSHSVKVANAEVSVAEHALEEVRIRTAEQTAEAFLELLSLQRAIQVKEQDLKERQSVERRAQEFFEVGLSSKLDLDLAEVGTSSAELALTQAHADEQAAWSKLLAALGQPQGGNYQLVEPSIKLEVPATVDSETEQAIANRPDLVRMQAEIEAQQERLEYAQSLRRPSLRAVFSGGYARFADPTAANQAAGGLGLFAPIYTGGSLKAEVRAEQSKLEALRSEYSFRELQVRTQVSQAHAKVIKTLSSAQANEKIASYAEEALRLARTRYNAQLISMVELLTAETTAESARAAYAQALYDYEIARARLSSTMGLQP
ncbi:MAG: TolC family protein [Acidobacteria bacterium]|nr:MAG: TolC family protein [Acidobacteriota bacterium]